MWMKEVLAAVFDKAVWFLKLYVEQYKGLLLFIAAFVLLYVFFMHWINVRFLNRLRQPAALISLAVELLAIASFTLLFREAGTQRRYELELFWSYRTWIFGKSVALGMEILNNILLFFPLGFVITDALKRCSFAGVLFLSGFISCLVEFSQYYFRLGLFEFDDIFNNVLGALAGWCVFHMLKGSRSR
ncbi:VanZ family protein [Mordavella massiliensis]|uniref:VanZ family protein n=1 Tax=Mordavella massiliensis TaxID=1871024 RepID=A0A939BIC2_9CLOT|nr:VanZ family protein [Mordavella massiliensis]MBM6949493.1 VanZ family protein [Mordavella massiliensis]